jgi:hypothetical protein
MGAEEYLVHTHHCRAIKKDVLRVWKPITGKDLPSIQIDQNNDVSASVEYTPEDAPALAMAILTAAGINATITLEGRP